MSTATRPRASGLASGDGWGFVAFAVLVVLHAALLAGCTTTTSTTQRTESADSRANAAPVDPERRAEARLELAAAYFAQGQTDVALKELNQALAANPNLGRAHNLQGLILASRGEAPAAEEAFRRALQINARDADAMHNYGWFLCQQRRFDDADGQFRQALEQPGYRDGRRTLLARGVCQARAGRLPEAERTLSRSYELDPSNSATAVNLAEVLYRRGELERARFYIARVNTQAGQSNAQTLWLAARIENRLGNHEGVSDFGRQLRNRFPKAPEALAFEQGRFDE